MSWNALTRRIRRPERGTAALELALVLTVLVMLCFGTITGGLVYYEKIALANAVREGARFAATAEVGTTTPTWSDAVKAHTVSASGGVLTTAQVCVVPPTGGGSCTPGPSSAPTVPAGSCVVRVRAEKLLPDGFNIVIYSRDVTLVQDAYARYERPC